MKQAIYDKIENQSITSKHDDEEKINSSSPTSEVLEILDETIQHFTQLETEVKHNVQQLTSDSTPIPSTPVPSNLPPPSSYPSDHEITGSYLAFQTQLDNIT